MNRLRRSLYLLAASLALTVVVLAIRALLATGAFVNIGHHFDGQCRTIPGGARDLAVDEKDGLVFASEANGLAVAHVAALEEGFVRLSGTPRQFLPSGLGLFRSDDGHIVLMAVDRVPGEDAAISTFDVHGTGAELALSQRSRITGG